METSKTTAISKSAATGSLQTKSWSNTTNTITCLFALFPLSLFTFQVSGGYLRSIQHVKDDPSTSHAPSDTATASEIWERKLTEMPSRVQKAHSVTASMFCGTLIIFQRLPQGPFQVCMVLIAIVCVAASCHTKAIGHFAESLTQSGLPNGWTDFDDQYAATSLALPEAVILGRDITASLCILYLVMAYEINPMKYYNYLRGHSSESGIEVSAVEPPSMTGKMDAVAMSMSTPLSTYITAGCVIVAFAIQYAATQYTLSRLLRSPNDLEKGGNKAKG